MIKKVLVFLLTLCISVGFLPVLAEDSSQTSFTDVLGTEYEQSVKQLETLKIITGYEDGTFRPHVNLTRAEFTAMITRIMSLDKEVEEAEGDQNFSDIEAGYWGMPYINVALSKNIINGYGDGRFGPEDPVTYEQAAKMIVQALGYSKAAEEKGPYPWGELLIAAEHGITRQARGVVGEAASRGLIAKMLYNSFNVRLATEDRTLGETLMGATYYLSPSGDDSGPGTEKQPWKTLRRAAAALTPGSTLILEDGEYVEPGTTTFNTGGTKDAPIVMKARNRHGAKLVYPESTRLTSKLFIPQGQDFITIDGLHFTQLSMAKDDDPSKTMDIYITCRGNDVNIINNRFTRAFEEAVKLTGSYRVLVAGNIIEDMNHEGIDSFNTTDVILRDNYITETGRVAIMVKGNSRNNLVYNNYIINKETIMNTAGITVGGVSNSTSPSDVAKDTGFEAYNGIFYNNIIYSEKPGLIRAGIAYIGARDCHSYNNLIIGTTSAVTFREPNGIVNGWGWDPPNVNPVLKNNIYVNCVSQGYVFTRQPQNLVSDYNLFFNTPVSTKEPNSKYTNPGFVEQGVDWRLTPDSPGAGAGIQLPSEFEGFGGSTIKIDFADYEGRLREGAWDMGPYSVK